MPGDQNDHGVEDLALSLGDVFPCVEPPVNKVVRVSQRKMLPAYGAQCPEPYFTTEDALHD